MNITLLDDYCDLVRSLNCVSLLGEHQLAVHTDCEGNPDVLAERLRDTSALVLLRERTPVTAALLAGLPRLKLITLNGPWPHVDLDACSARGIVLCSEYARTAVCHGETHVGIDHRGHAPHSAVNGTPQERPVAKPRRQRVARTHVGHLRRWAHRQTGRDLWQGLRHARTAMKWRPRAKLYLRRPMCCRCMCAW